MLTLDAASYRYAGAPAASLREVSLSVAPGEVVGVVGASESGKSTLCLVASGLAPRVIGGHLRGTVSVGGHDLAELRAGEVASRVGIAFQDPASQLTGVSATVFEEVAFGPMNLGLPQPDVLARTSGALAALGIDGLAARDPDHLSGGQRQLVAVAGMLALDPAVLILDEPTSELDPAGTGLVGEAIGRIAAAGRAILIVEHDTDLVARTCSRVVLLAGGRIVRDGPAADVLADPDLASLGVEPPTEVRLSRAAAAAGLDPGRLVAAG